MKKPDVETSRSISACGGASLAQPGAAGSPGRPIVNGPAGTWTKIDPSFGFTYSPGLAPNERPRSGSGGRRSIGSARNHPGGGDSVVGVVEAVDVVDVDAVAVLEALSIEGSVGGASATAATPTATSATMN